MDFIAALRRLWRHAEFRRLLLLRMLTQAADGTMQIGIASYVLFSPQSQPNAWAIAGVLAISLLPYTILGPLLSPLLDRWSRRDVALYSDIGRAGLALLIAVVIFFDRTSGWGLVVLMVALLLALSVNRFMLAGLSAGLQHTVTKDEYLSASSIIPTMGPLGIVIGGVLGFGTRLILGRFIPAHQADAVIFVIAAAMFVASAFTAARFGRWHLGPDHTVAARVSMRRVLHGLVDAARHIRGRSAAAIGLVAMAVTRFLFGLLSVMVILIARNRWHPVDEPEAAMADISVWGLMTGAGFLLAAGVVPTLVRTLGLRTGVVALLVLGGVAQSVATFTGNKWAIFGLSFVVGLVAQCVKICVDALVQAHVGEQYKGRAFTFYDMGFNGAYVLAAVVAASTLPPDGFSPAAFAGMTLTYLFLAGLFAWVSTRIGVEDFDRGTGDLRGAARA
ncbi:MAG: MFS transporter [Propionibacterium sp.]|nr:MFS transporter [Propionibacterium sp.]